MPEKIYHDLYLYHPSVAAAEVTTVLFALITSLHLFQLIRTRAWFMIPFFFGGTCKLKNLIPVNLTVALMAI